MRSIHCIWGILLASASLAVCLPRSMTGANTGIDPQLASRYFQEASDMCMRDGGKLWGTSLCGAVLFADPASREVAANQPDAQAGLTQTDNVFVGHLPQTINIANTALVWTGIHWTMIMWPLPADPTLRNQLMMHELFHRIQDQIGLPASNPFNAHLDSLEGRIWLELEWRSLAHALSTRGAERRTAVEDALVFRSYRRTLFTNAAPEERALEMNEGLAEYTGVKLRGTSEAETINYLLQRLKNAPNDPSFMRSFAYVSGPPEGLLLDLAGAEWRKGLTPQEDLGALLAEAYHIRLPQDLEEQAKARSKDYDGSELRAAEIWKDNERKKLLAQYRVQLVDGPVLVIPLRKMNFQFNPNNLVALGSLGTVYPTIRVSDEWGILTVTGGALMAPNWTQISVSAPQTPVTHPLRGTGWTLELSPGWRITRGPRPGDFALRKETE